MHHTYTTNTHALNATPSWLAFFVYFYVAFGELFGG